MGHSKKKHKSKKQGQKPNKGKNQKSKALHDFKSKGQSEAINSKLIDLERNRYNKKSYIMWGILILGFLLLILGIADSSFEFEGFGMKIKGSLVGLILIVIGIIMYFSTSNFKAEIED